MTNPNPKLNHWISATVRLSRKSYFPGAVVSGILTVEPTSELSQEEYISFISIQLHGHIGVIPNLALLPKELRKDKQHRNATPYGNITKFQNDSTECLYQTNPILLDGDITLRDKKAYFFQIQLPKPIPPSMKTSCVRYFHLLSFCFSDKEAEPHYISIPITVLTPSSYTSDTQYEFTLNPLPIETKSFYEDITNEYMNNSSITVSEEVLEPSTQHDDSIPLEFNHLYKLNVHDSILDDIWSRAKYYTSYTDYLTANPGIQPTNDDSDITYKPKHQFNIFSITHNNNTVANVQLCTSPLVMGDIIQIVADFSDVFYKCDQMVIALYMDEYAPYLKDRWVKSSLVMSNTVITKDLKKYPYSFSIPTNYPPSFTSPQVKIVWKLKFTFSINKKSSSDGEYVFDPEVFLSQSYTKVDWSYDLQVRSCVNERFNDILGEKCEFNGKEESFTL